MYSPLHTTKIISVYLGGNGGQNFLYKFFGRGLMKRRRYRKLFLSPPLPFALIMAWHSAQLFAAKCLRACKPSQREVFSMAVARRG